MTTVATHNKPVLLKVTLPCCGTKTSLDLNRQTTGRSYHRTCTNLRCAYQWNIDLMEDNRPHFRRKGRKGNIFYL